MRRILKRFSFSPDSRPLKYVSPVISFLSASTCSVASFYQSSSFLSAVPSSDARLSTIPQSIHCKVEHQAVCKQGLVFELRVSRPRCPPLHRSSAAANRPNCRALCSHIIAIRILLEIRISTRRWFPTSFEDRRISSVRETKGPYQRNG